MQVYNENKTEILTEYDLKKGYLKSDKIVKEVLPAQEEVKEIGHYETIKEYENGGKDVKWVVDVAGQEAKPETPIYEDIQIYMPYTADELKELRIAELKNLLASYDYIGIKIATGRATIEEYAEQIAQMTKWAEEINELEGGDNE